MRFLADMGVSVRVVEWLRASGHDAVHLRNERLHTLANGGIFAKAMAEQRIVLTFDLDFGEIAAFSRKGRCPVIVFRLRNTRVAHVIDRLARVLAVSEPDITSDTVIIIEETRYRIRRFLSNTNK